MFAHAQDFAEAARPGVSGARPARTSSTSAGLSQDEPLVVIVDDHPDVREALGDLVRSYGMDVISFGTAGEFLDAALPDRPTCLMLDVRLPDLNGLDLQARLEEEGSGTPIIFMSGCADVRMSVRAMRAGAVDFLAKPFAEPDLLAALETAVAQSREVWNRRRAASVVRARADRLSARERQVLQLVVTGLTNRKVAESLSISEITVKIHRGSAARKLGTRSLPEMVWVAEMLWGGEAVAAEP